MTDHLVSSLLSAIQEREDVAKAARQQALSGDWRSVVDAGSGDSHVESRKGALVAADPGLFEIGPHIALNDPRSVLRLCQAHRNIIDMFPVSAPHTDTEGSFYGFQSRECGEHRTVGPHRAWCFDCAEWCYPHAPCVRCHGVSDVLVALAEGYGIEAES